MASSSTRIYRFGNCHLNTVERKLYKNNIHLKIASKSFDIVQMLLKRQGEVVTKEEILLEVWSDCYVEEGNLTVCVSKLRKALDTNKSESFIETVFGVGYRFASKIESFTADQWENLPIDEDISKKNKAPIDRELNSIAVMPLKNENGDQEIAYLADGITEGVINNLSYIPNLQVIARDTVFRYKDRDLEFQIIGRELDVQNILTGRIRIIDDMLIIGIELINTKDSTQIWGTQINQIFEDIFKAQQKIVKTILEKLNTDINFYLT